MKQAKAKVSSVNSVDQVEIKPPSFLAKLGAYFAGLNYSYGLRVVIGVAIAWFVAFRLQTDKPYWSIMTVVIVTLPLQSMLVERFIARLIGTLVGAIMVNVIAVFALNDQWLFTIYMGFWLSLCAYLATAKSPMTTYCFALCGYTSAILGFALSISPSGYMVFQISQARILEILIGLVVAFFVSMLWPAYLERIAIKQKLRLQRAAVRRLYQALLTPDYPQEEFNNQYEKILLGLMDFRDLIFQEFLSVSTLREDNQAVYRYTYRLIRAVSGILALYFIKKDLLKKAALKAPLESYLHALNSWFSSPSTTLRKLDSQPKAPKVLLDHPKGRIFVEKLSEKFQDLYSTKLEKSLDESLYIPSRKIYYSDKKEAIINAVRTFASIMLGMFIWMETQWDVGYILLILIGILCTLGATFPMATKLLTITFIVSIFVTVPLSFALKFGILINVNHIIPAMMVVLPLYLFAAMLQVKSMLGYLIGYSFLMGSAFLIGFSNPMTYNFEAFANQVYALLSSLAIILVIFHLIRPSSDTVKMQRMKREIAIRFSEQVNQTTDRSIKDFGAYLSSAVQRIKTVPAMPAKTEFLAYGFLASVILKEQRRMEMQGIAWDLPLSLQQSIEDERIKDALEETIQLEANAQGIPKSAYWILRCALISFNDFLEAQK